MKKYKIIAIMGKAGSGKDTLLHSLIKAHPDFHEIISCTTRPKREKEIEGINYFFLTQEQFFEKTINNEMLEISRFNNWAYGTSYNSLSNEKINVGVFNPTGIRSLLDNPNIDVDVYYVRAADKTRLLRQLNREENPDIEEIIRRYKADEKDFNNLDFSYKVLDNEIYDDLLAGVDAILSSLKG
jgi:guanylate kinase